MLVCLLAIFTFYSVRCPHIRKNVHKRIQNGRAEEFGKIRSETVIATLINFGCEFSAS